MSVLDRVVEEAENGVKMRIYVKPESPRKELRLELGELTYYTPEPPVAGKANASLKRFLSHALNVSSSFIEIVYGVRSKVKIVVIKNVKKDDVVKALKDIVRA